MGLAQHIKDHEKIGLDREFLLNSGDTGTGNYIFNSTGLTFDVYSTAPDNVNAKVFKATWDVKTDTPTNAAIFDVGYTKADESYVSLVNIKQSGTSAAINTDKSTGWAMQVGGSSIFGFTSTYAISYLPLRPNSNATTDLGITGTRWRRGYFNQLVSVDTGTTTAALDINQTSTGDIVDFKDSGTSIFKIADGGNITLGGATLDIVTGFYGRTTALSGGKSPNYFQFQVLPGSANSSVSASAMQGLLILTPTTGYSISGTSRGMQYTVQNNGAGTVNTARGLDVGVTNTGGGTITTGYGLYISPVAGTTSYGIYQGTATNGNYFAGDVGIGNTPSSNYKLYVYKSMPSVAGTTNYNIFSDISVGDADSTMTGVGGYFRAKSSYSQSTLTGLLGTSYADGAGKTVTTMRGLDFSFNVAGATTTATEATCINVTMNNAGTVTNGYGIKIIKNGTGTWTNAPYGIYENIGGVGGMNYLSSRTGVGALPVAYSHLNISPIMADHASSEYYTMQTYPFWRPTNDVAKNFMGVVCDVNVDATNSPVGNLTGSYIGGRFQTVNRLPGSITMANATGGLFKVYNGGGVGTGIILSAKAGNFTLQNDGTSNMVTGINAYIGLPSGTGTITNLYGLLIEDMVAGTTLNYAIRTNAGNIVFNENGDANTDFRVEGDTDANLLMTDASDNAVKLGGASTSKLGCFGATPVVQQNHIVDADGTLADLTTKYNTLLAQLEAYGLLKTS